MALVLLNILLCLSHVTGDEGLGNKFKSLSGYFMQDFKQPANTPSRLGAILPTWNDLDLQLRSLNKDAKLLYLVRHGEGIHNVAEATYGTAAWDAKYALDPMYTDAQLTDLGVQQAQGLNAVVMNEVKEGLYLNLVVSSPLTRTLNTTAYVFQGLGDKTLVMEGCRELIGLHTCDKRSSISQLQPLYRTFDFSLIANDSDVLWGTMDESHDEARIRASKFLNELWLQAGPKVRYIAVVTHNSFIQALLAAVGHVPYYPKNIDLIPVVITRVAPVNDSSELVNEGRELIDASLIMYIFSCIVCLTALGYIYWNYSALSYNRLERQC